MNIVVSYNPPPGIVLGPNEYRAASGLVNITCIALGGSGTVSFRWSSTCRNCTFQSSTSKKIIRWATHSGDIGTHTCTATDGVGNSGRGNITFNVTGMLPTTNISRKWIERSSQHHVYPQLQELGYMFSKVSQKDLFQTTGLS